MAGNPFDFDRDGRWETHERAFAHYGIGGELRRADAGGGEGGGCGTCLAGCALPLLALLALLGLVTCAAA